MKSSFSNILSFAVCVFIIGTSSCKKMGDTPEGAAKIYLTAAVNSTYLVPGTIKNYVADKATKKLHIPVYIYRSGMQKQDQFTVNVAADDAAAQKLISSGAVNASKAIVAPAAVYVLPATATAGQDYASFEAVFDANKLGAYLGKLLILSVHISNPSRFELNEALSTLNIIVDVDLVMLGAKLDVTSQFLKNPSNPFNTTAYDGSRRGVLADWITSPSVKNYGGGTYGGYDNYGGSGYMAMERYSSPAIPNGKIYQTVRLTASKYVFTAEFESFGVVDRAYVVAAAGASLPDADNIGAALSYAPFETPSIEFIVDTDKDVSMGILADLQQDLQWFRIKSFKLFRYQNIFE